MIRRRRTAGITSLVLMAAGGLVGCSGDDEPTPRGTAQEFLDAWADGDLRGAARHTDDASAARSVLRQTNESLAPTKVELTAGDGSRDGDTATVPFTAAWTLPGVAAAWTYENTLSLHRTDDEWTVDWSPAVVHPKLTDGAEFAVTRTLPDRAPILDSAGQPLFQKTDVVVVGIEPRLVEDLDALAGTLASELRISAEDIVAAVRQARPDHFVPVISLRRPDYDRVKDRIHNLPGTKFREESRVLGPSAHFAQPTLGRVGEATEEVLDEVGAEYAAGDQLGISGLQRALNAELSGRAGATISVGEPDSDTRTPVGQVEPQPGKPVTLTLDRRVQTAAETAVAGMPRNSAIVAVRPSSGELLAVANGPNATFDMAMSAQVPPGSTFKIITTAALLEAGVVAPDAQVDCPGRTTLGGRVFQNSNAFDLGRVSLRTAFAASCNTTMITLAQQIDGAALVEAAAQFGIGAGWQLPVTAFSGSLPAPDDPVSLAAQAIGQGQVLVSPFAMALVAATVANGSAPTPVLVKGEPGTPTNAPPVLDESVRDVLREFTRAVVTEGTGRELAGLPGEPVAGKTGTAEFGNADGRGAHAWFAGYQGDLAFAVFVENGESSTTTAVPLARTFLSGLQ